VSALVRALPARSSSLFRLGSGASPGSADGSHLPAASASAEEPIAAIGLEPRHTHSRRHLDLLQEPVPFEDRPASRRSRRLPKCRARARRRSR